MDNNLNNDLDNKNLESNTENKKDEVTLEKVEELRYNVFCVFATFVLIAVFLFLFALIYFVFTFNFRIFIILGLLFLPAIIIAGIAPNEIRIFNAAYKKYFISLVLKENFRDTFFDINKGIDKSVIEETQVIKLGDTYYSSDYTSGFYKNIKFEYSDVNTFDYNTNYTFFYGRWFIFDFNKKFKSNIQICENTFVNRKQNGRLFNKRSYFEKIHLEDIDFNKKFSVFAQNEMEAFYILTPHFLEKIKELNENIRGKFIFCFLDNKLHVGLANNNDKFEANMFKTINEDFEKKKVFNEIKIIIDFIEMLNLDDTLFM